MTEQPALEFGGLLWQLRAGAKLTQEELAEAASLSPRSVSDLERGINRTARRDTAVLLVGALGRPEPVGAVFVAAARGRVPAAEVLAALRGETPETGGLASGRDPVWPGCPYLGLVPFGERDERVFYGRGELVDLLVRWVVERLGHKLVVSAGADGTVRLWNTNTRQEVGAPITIGPPINPDAPDTGGGVFGVAFSPDGTLPASADADGTVRLWNTVTRQDAGAPITAITPGTGLAVGGVAFSPDGTLLAGAYRDGTVQTWQVSLFADPYAALCADVGPLTKAEWTQNAPGEPQPSVCG